MLQQEGNSGDVLFEEVDKILFLCLFKLCLGGQICLDFEIVDFESLQTSDLSFYSFFTLAAESVGCFRCFIDYF